MPRSGRDERRNAATSKNWNDQVELGYRPRCARSVGSPSAQSCPGPLGARRSRRQPALVVAPADPGRVRRGRPRDLGVDRARPGPAARRRDPPSGSRSWPPTRASWTGWASAKADLDAYLGGDRWYPRRAGDDAPTRDRLLLAGVRHHRGPAAVLRRPRHPRRRPPEGGQRPRRPARRRRPALPARLLQAVAVARGLAAGAATRSSTPTSCRSRLLREANGERALISIALPGGPDLLAQVWVAQVGRVPLLLLDSDVEGNPDHYREVTDRLYGGTTEHRLLQEMLLGIGGVRALRAHARITGTPEPEVFHTNEGHAGFLGLERIRELTVEEGGPKLDFDEALEVSRASTVFTTHTPVPAGIDRFPRELIEQYFGTAGPLAGVPVEQGAGARRRGLRRRRPDGLQHGGDGLPARPARQRRLPAARRRQPRDVPRPVAGVRRGRGADHVDHQRRARADLGRPRGLRPRRAARRQRRRRRGRLVLAGRRPGAVADDLVGEAPAARAAGPRRPAAAATSCAQARLPEGRAAPGSTRRSTPTC